MSETQHSVTHALAGRWQQHKAELAGEAAPELINAKLELELTDRHYIVRFGGEISDRGTYTMDPASDPKTITLHGTEGTNKGRTLPAIYQLAGSRLRICYALEGKQRPAEFKTRPGEKHYLALYHKATA